MVSLPLCMTSSPSRVPLLRSLPVVGRMSVFVLIVSSTAPLMSLVLLLMRRLRFPVIRVRFS